MRTKRSRPNWPYRWAWLSIVAAILLFVLLQTLIAGFTFAKHREGIDWPTAFLSALLDTTIACWFFAVGASIGSFLNVVAYRLPLGRNAGGHSSCPYCGMMIQGKNNIPILSWLRLRGRCADCRLPISIQYPLVEFGVGIIFLFVYATEFFCGGGNLPGERAQPLGVGGLGRIAVSSELVLRLATYFCALGGLIAVALIAAKRKPAPVRLFVWSLMPWVLAVAAMPDLIVIRWRDALPAGAVEARLDALTTILCGAVAGIAIARLLSPLIYPGFDRGLLAADPKTRGARQLASSLAVAGALIGWQAVVGMTALTIVCGIIGSIFTRRWASEIRRSDLTIWVWMGLLTHRAVWKGLLGLPFPEVIPDVCWYIGGALALAPLAVLYRNLTQASEVQPKTKTQIDDEYDDWDELKPTAGVVHESYLSGTAQADRISRSESSSSIATLPDSEAPELGNKSTEQKDST